MGKDNKAGERLEQNHPESKTGGRNKSQKETTLDIENL